MMGAAPAFADEIGDAAKQLAAASYDFAKEVDWNNGIYLQAPGAFTPLEASKADWEAVNAALGRVIASVPESTVMDVYNSVSSITDPKVPAYLKSLVNGADAEKAYDAFLTFKDVVKKNQVSSAGAPASAVSGDKIGEAAKKLSDASYPFLKDVDWTSDLFLKEEVRG